MAGALHGVLASLKAAAASATDTFFRYVSLLLNTTSTNGAQNNTFLDSSTNNFSITRNGNTTQGTFSPFSQTGWSNYFDGTGDDLRSANAGAAANLGATWTVELWAYPSNVSGTGSIVNVNINTANAGVNIYRNGATITVDDGVTGGTGPSGGTLVANTWQHVAVVADGTNTKIYLSGTQVGSTFSGTVTSGTPTHFWVGACFSGLSNWTGYLSNVRIVKGTAVYTANFTPPTAPLTNITNTSLLTCQSNRFIDNSSNAFTITRNGDVSVQAFSPFNPTAAWDATTNGGSGYFDGTGDYLSVADNAAFEFGSGDFTTEAWIYLTGYSANYAGAFGGVIFAKNSSNSDLGFYLVLGGTASSWTDLTVLQYYSGSSNESTTGSFTFNLNTWYHVAATKSSGSVRIFVNGTQVNTTATFTQSQTDTTAGFTIAGQNFPTYTYNLPGYIASARAVKGTAVYTANFTPPTAPLTAITNTSLLCNFTNAGIFDSASGNDLETVGNAQVSTVQSKWGTTSLAFDGTGDWLLNIDKPALRLGTAAFTIEMWVYRSASGTYGLVSKGTSTTGWSVSLNASNQVVFSFAASSFNSTGTVAATTWTHITVVREGTGTNQTKIYISGTNDGTGTVATDFNQTSAMYVGADRVAGGAFNGYIDDLRITNGYARYTANFTAPTAAFPLQ